MAQVGQEKDTDHTLFWESMSGAMAVELVFEEMGMAYRLRPVDMAAGEYRSDDYLKLNPIGQDPALAIPDGRIIGESAAIILTSGDRHPATGLVPVHDATERPIFLRWLLYMAASPCMTFVQFNLLSPRCVPQGCAGKDHVLPRSAFGRSRSDEHRPSVGARPGRSRYRIGLEMGSVVASFRP